MNFISNLKHLRTASDITRHARTNWTCNSVYYCCHLQASIETYKSQDFLNFVPSFCLDTRSLTTRIVPCETRRKIIAF